MPPGLAHLGEMAHKLVMVSQNLLVSDPPEVYPKLFPVHLYPLQIFIHPEVTYPFYTQVPFPLFYLCSLPDHYLFQFRYLQPFAVTVYLLK